VRIVHSILCLPALALAATFSGTVVDLSGAPIAGAVVKTLADSATTPGNGSWTLARTVSVARRNAKPVSVASHLVVQNGRPRLVFGGVEASGHRSAAVQSAPLELAAGRTTAAVGTDTLKLFWKGKRLVVLPIASADSTGIVLRVDTAWSDDASIPWNPAISYGSVFDARDGRTYRTVAIGLQRWMAENLNYAVDSSWWYGNSPDSGAKCGRLYYWASAMGLADSFDTLLFTASGPVPRTQGVCPSGWHIPLDLDWDTLVTAIGSAASGTALKSTQGWISTNTYPGPNNGTDRGGFRGIPSGYRYVDSKGAGAVFDPGSPDGITKAALWWSATEYLSWNARHFDLYAWDSITHRLQTTKPKGFAVRCLLN
jgi:uncharacterized protein (TIGR02145 family)